MYGDVRGVNHMSWDGHVVTHGDIRLEEYMLEQKTKGNGFEPSITRERLEIESWG